MAVSRALSKTGRVQYAGELTDTGKQNMKKLKSVMHRFSDLSRGALGQFVIADESVENDAYYDPETGYIVLGKDVLEREDGVKKSVSRAWFAAALHEVTHGVDKTVSGVFMEVALGTLEDGEHYSRVFKELSNRGYLPGKASDIRRRIERYMEKQAKGQALTEREAAELNVFHSECAPLIAERVLNNEHFLRELIAEDASLVERLLGKLADLRESTSRVRDPEAQAVIREIHAIEEMLLDAVAERGMVYRDRKLVMVNRERGREEEEDAKYSLKKTTDGRFIAVVDDDILNGINTNVWNSETRNKVKKAAKNALMKFKDGIRVWDVTAKVNKDSRDEYTRSQYSEALRKHDADTYSDKMRAAAVIDDVVSVATDWAQDKSLTHPRKDNLVDVYRGKTLIKTDTAVYEAVVVIGKTNRGEYQLHDVVEMNPVDQTKQKIEVLTAATPNDSFGAILEDSDEDIVSHPDDSVNRENAENLQTSSDKVQQSRKPKAKKPANEHAFDDAVARMEERDASSDEKAAEGNISSAEKVDSQAERITVDMSETDRAEILKHKKVTPQKIEIIEDLDVDWDALAQNKWAVVKTSRRMRFPHQDNRPLHIRCYSEKNTRCGSDLCHPPQLEF